MDYLCALPQDVALREASDFLALAGNARCGLIIRQAIGNNDDSKAILKHFLPWHTVPITVLCQTVSTSRKLWDKIIIRYSTSVDEDFYADTRA